MYDFRSKSYIDVWPASIYVPDNSGYMDNCSLYVLQLACVLHMVKGWKQSTSLRVFMCHTGLLVVLQYMMTTAVYRSSIFRINFGLEDKK